MVSEKPPHIELPKNDAFESLFHRCSYCAEALYKIMNGESTEGIPDGTFIILKNQGYILSKQGLTGMGVEAAKYANTHGFVKHTEVID